jgi:ATP-dependent exoDNAse (exonuclease V) alpha subunit
MCLIALQLYRLSKYNQRSRPTNDGRMSSLFADVVVIDEAGQLSLSLAALALRALQQDGRIVIAGDSEQLAPILAAQYPETDACLFGSVLDVVMHRSMSSAERAQTSTAKTVHKNKPVGREGSGLTQSQESTIVQLTENFRYAAFMASNPCCADLTLQA